MTGVSMLKLKFLGEIKIQLDQEDISAKISSKGAAMVAILMMQKNKRISRRELLGFLWPESTDDAAKYNLRYNLWQLKKLIPPDGQGEHFLIVTKDFCKVNEAYDFQCDLRQIVEADIDNISDISSLEGLRELLAGDFFENQYFSGCDEFEEMIIMQRYSLENKKLSLLKKMIAVYFDQNLQDKCLAALADCEEMDPYDEENAEKRLLILTSRGNYRDAVRYYQRFCNKLAFDIGVEPSETLKGLAGQIRNQEKKAATVYHLDTRCMKTVECYWMSSVLRALAQIADLRLADYLSPGQMADLSYIEREFGDQPAFTSLARVVDSFLALLTGLCQDQKSMEIKIENPEDMDQVSMEVMALLRELCGTRLVIIEG